MNGTVLAYWWSQRPNFGDLLSPLLIQRFAGITPVWAPPENADLVCAGSVLDVLPLGWTGVVAGSGVLHEHTRIDLRHATILGLRGKLTWELAQSGNKTDAVLGDPGLLVAEFVPAVEKKHKVGVLPHWTDVELAYRFPDAHHISSAADPFTVIGEIASCEQLIASSLHGAVVADSFHMPRQVEPFAPKKYEGGTFKFHDYASGLGFPMKFGEMQSVPKELIDARQSELFGMFERLPDALGAAEWTANQKS